MENPVNPREDISEKARNLTIRIMEDVRNFLRKAVERIKADKKLSRNLITATRSILVVLGFFFILWFLLYAVPGLQDMTAGGRSVIKNDQELVRDKEYKQLISQMKRDIQSLSRKYNSYTSGQSYIVINTTHNRFSLYTNKKLIREGFCSSGSYTMLKADGEKKWIFRTPKGKYRIQSKISSPVWRKPDWAFVEEGLPIPSANHPSRYEHGVLGDYALSIGDGYLIHGTLYKRLLGMPVTHGCVRLNDEDLEAIYNTLNIGSKVYIY